MSIGYIEKEFREMAEEERDSCMAALKNLMNTLGALPHTTFTTYSGTEKKVEEIEYVRWADVEAALEETHKGVKADA